MKRRDRPSRQGFTLVELMIVVTVLAILATLLVPVAQMMLSRAYAQKCYATCRTIAVEVRTYATKWKGWTPDDPDYYVKLMGLPIRSDNDPNKGPLWNSIDSANDTTFKCPVDDMPKYNGHGYRSSYVNLVGGINIMNLPNVASTVMVAELGDRHPLDKGGIGSHIIYGDLHGTKASSKDDTFYTDGLTYRTWQANDATLWGKIRTAKWYEKGVIDPLKTGVWPHTIWKADNDTWFRNLCQVSLFGGTNEAWDGFEPDGFLIRFDGYIKIAKGGTYGFRTDNLVGQLWCWVDTSRNEEMDGGETFENNAGWTFFSLAKPGRYRIGAAYFHSGTNVNNSFRQRYYGPDTNNADWEIGVIGILYNIPGR